MQRFSRRLWWLPFLAARSMEGQEAPVVATGETGETVAEFIATIGQNGASFTATGYMTALAGLPEALLFTNPVTRSMQAARFTISVNAQLISRNIIKPMFVLDESGTATVSFSESGETPTVIATGSVTLQTSVQVTSAFVSATSPGKGNFRLTGEFSRKGPGAFTIEGVTYKFGDPTVPWILNATGDGTLTDPNTPISQVVAVGNVVVGGDNSRGRAPRRNGGE